MPFVLFKKRGIKKISPHGAKVYVYVPTNEEFIQIILNFTANKVWLMGICSHRILWYYGTFAVCCRNRQ